MSGNSYVATINNMEVTKNYRVADDMARILRIPLLKSASDCIQATRLDDVDRVIVVGGNTVKCAYGPDIAELVFRARHTVWVPCEIKNDFPYQITREARERGIVGPKQMWRPPTVWTPVFGHVDLEPKWNCRVFSLNVSALAMRDPLAWGRRDQLPVYYGSWRKLRAKRFRQFLPSFCRVIATTRRTMETFDVLMEDKQFWITPPIADRTSLIREIARHAMTIILQDRWDDIVPQFPPVRFYESLAARTAMVMPSAVADRLEYSGYRVRPQYVVKNAMQVRRKLEQARSIAERQNREWAGRAKEDLHETVREINRLMTRLNR